MEEFIIYINICSGNIYIKKYMNNKYQNIGKRVSELFV